jgi:hypothetical protein
MQVNNISTVIQCSYHANLEWGRSWVRTLVAIGSHQRLIKFVFVASPLTMQDKTVRAKIN